MAKRKRNESGQATVEFALTLILLIAFVLFYFQLSLIFAFGNYVHYATFMAARAYLSSGPTIEDQQERAKVVILRLLKKSESQAGIDKFPMIAKGVGGGDPAGFQITPPGQFDEKDPNFSWLQGARYKFRGRLFMIPLAGYGKGSKDTSDSESQPGQSGASVNSLTLTSESWLGREPAYDECEALMEGKVWDNGC